jgi:hypothetical protein
MRVNEDVFDCPGCRPDTEVVPLEEVAQAIAVDEVDWRRTVAGGFLLRILRECAGGNEQAFVSAARHRAAEVTDRAAGRLSA